MDCEEKLVEQAATSRAANPNAHVWVYRNSLKALPWFSSVRATLDDPAYAPWFLKFKDGVNGSYHVPACDNNFDPSRCSAYYHDQVQTPEYPSGDGSCAQPCDCGSVPCGEYLWDFRALNTSVNGQTLKEWFITNYSASANAIGNPNIDGLFFDDQWQGANGPTEIDTHVMNDTGSSVQDFIDITAGWSENLQNMQANLLTSNAFSWQQLTNGGTCADAVIKQSTCTSQLRSICPNNAQQTQALFYGFTGQGCSSFNLTAPEQDIANFLLIRGPYAWLGYSWNGCSKDYPWPAGLDVDYGEPVGFCEETVPGSSGVFTRQWTNANVTMDCNTWTPHITML
jgi:hypothetical protein